jgi:hypothetical protein
MLVTLTIEPLPLCSARGCARGGRQQCTHSRCGVSAGLPVQLTVVLPAFGTNEYTRVAAVPQWYTESHPCEFPMCQYTVRYDGTSMRAGGLRFLGRSAAHMSTRSSYTLADTDQYACSYGYACVSRSMCIGRTHASATACSTMRLCATAHAPIESNPWLRRSGP